MWTLTAKFVVCGQRCIMPMSGTVRYLYYCCLIFLCNLWFSEPQLALTQSVDSVWIECKAGVKNPWYWREFPDSLNVIDMVRHWRHCIVLIGQKTPGFYLAEDSSYVDRIYLVFVFRLTLNSSYSKHETNLVDS